MLPWGPNGAVQSTLYLAGPSSLSRYPSFPGWLPTPLVRMAQSHLPRPATYVSSCCAELCGQAQERVHLVRRRTCLRQDTGPVLAPRLVSSGSCSFHSIGLVCQGPEHAAAAQCESMSACHRRKERGLPDWVTSNRRRAVSSLRLACGLGLLGLPSDSCVHCRAQALILQGSFAVLPALPLSPHVHVVSLCHVPVMFMLAAPHCLTSCCRLAASRPGKLALCRLILQPLLMALGPLCTVPWARLQWQAGIMHHHLVARLCMRSVKAAAA